MPNSTNTSWIVSCVKIDRSGRKPVVKHCDSRSYRHEKYALERYEAVVESLEEQGYSIEKMDVSDDEEYEGVCAFSKTSFAVVYIDRNPVWHR